MRAALREGRGSDAIGCHPRDTSFMEAARARSRRRREAVGRIERYSARMTDMGLTRTARTAGTSAPAIGVDAANDLAHGGQERGRRTTTRADDEVFGVVGAQWTLGHERRRHIQLRFARALQAANADVAHDAHHAPRAIPEQKALAERIFVRPVALDERFADDRHLATVTRVGVLENRDR